MQLTKEEILKCFLPSDYDIKRLTYDSGPYGITTLTIEAENLFKRIMTAMFDKAGQIPQEQATDIVPQADVNKELLDLLIRARRFVFSVAPMGGLFEAIDAAINKAEGKT